MTDAHLAFGPELQRVFPDAWTRHFWDAAREHRLVVARCAACRGTFRMPPTAFCWNCRSQETEWVELPGTGTVYTFTIARHPLTPAAQDAVPYVIAVISLDGASGARLISNVVGVPPGEVAIDLPVEVVYDDVSDELTIPRSDPDRAEPRSALVPRFVIAGIGPGGRSTVIQSEVFDPGAPDERFEGGRGGAGIRATMWTGSNPPVVARPTGMPAYDLGCPPDRTKWVLWSTAPNTEGSFHRTDTIDYDVVVAGELTLLLEDGEVQLEAGDCVVILGVAHAWRSGSTGASLSALLVGLGE